MGGILPSEGPRSSTIAYLVHMELARPEGRSTIVFHRLQSVSKLDAHRLIECEDRS